MFELSIGVIKSICFGIGLSVIAVFGIKNSWVKAGKTVKFKKEATKAMKAMPILKDSLNKTVKQMVILKDSVKFLHNEIEIKDEKIKHYNGVGSDSDMSRRTIRKKFKY